MVSYQNKIRSQSQKSRDVVVMWQCCTNKVLNLESIDLDNVHILQLKHNITKDKIAQANTHTQRHTNNAWSEMVTLTPCLPLYWNALKKILNLRSLKENPTSKYLRSWNLRQKLDSTICFWESLSMISDEDLNLIFYVWVFNTTTKVIMKRNSI